MSLRSQIVADRLAGMRNGDIATKHGIQYRMIGYHLRKAIRAGVITAEQVGLRPWKKPDAETIKREWIDRVRARTITNAQGCWLWQGTVTHNGYGQTSYDGRNLTIHRQMYRLVHDVKLTKEQCVCHRCDNRRCCNPEHLFLGTFDINNKDMAAKGRCKYSEAVWPVCKNGHEFTPENTRICKRGFRHCKACEFISNRRRHGWPEHLARDLTIKVPAGYKLDFSTREIIPAGRRSKRSDFSVSET